jgi:hypothetical protein
MLTCSVITSMSINIHYSLNFSPTKSCAANIVSANSSHIDWRKQSITGAEINMVNLLELTVFYYCRKHTKDIKG